MSIRDCHGGGPFIERPFTFMDVDWDETLEILNDPDLMAMLRASEKDIAEGKVTPHEDVWKLIEDS